MRLYLLSVFVMRWLCSRNTKGEWNNKMVCKGICGRHKAMKPIGTGRYSIGQKRCQVCEIFLKWNGLWCPCCGYRLRTRPRNSKFKAELRARKEIDKAKSIGVYEQPPVQAHQRHIAHKRKHWGHLRPKLSNIKWISIVVIECTTASTVSRYLVAKKNLKSMYLICIFHTFPLQNLMPLLARKEKNTLLNNSSRNY